MELAPVRVAPKRTEHGAKKAETSKWVRGPHFSFFHDDQSLLLFLGSGFWHSEAPPARGELLSGIHQSFGSTPGSAFVGDASIQHPSQKGFLMQLQNGGYRSR